MADQTETRVPGGKEREREREGEGGEGVVGVRVHITACTGQGKHYRNLLKCETKIGKFYVKMENDWYTSMTTTSPRLATIT